MKLILHIVAWRTCTEACIFTVDDVSVWILRCVYCLYQTTPHRTGVNIQQHSSASYLEMTQNMNCIEPPVRQEPAPPRTVGFLTR